MNRAVAVILALAFLSVAHRADATEIIVKKTDYPICQDTNTLIFVQHPFNRTMLYQGNHVKMTEKRFKRILKEPLTEAKWRFAAYNILALSAFYADTGDIRKLRNLTANIERLYSEPMLREILLSNPNTYPSYLGRTDGLATHQFHLWLGTGDSVHLKNALTLAREQLQVWSDLKSTSKYDEFETFVESIVPPPPPPLEKGQKLPEPRLGAGIRTGMPPRVREFDRRRTLMRGMADATRIASPIFVDAAIYLQEPLFDSELKIVSGYYEALGYDREETADGVYDALDKATELSNAFHGEWVDAYTDIILSSIARRLKSEHPYIKASAVLQRSYSTPASTHFYKVAERKYKSCDSVETLRSMKMHEALWKIISIEAGLQPMSACSKAVEEAQTIQHELKRELGRKKWTVFGGTVRLKNIADLNALKTATARLEKTCPGTAN